MLSKIEKLGFMLLALLLATLIFLALVPNETKETKACQELCALRNSEIKLYEPGVCVCQK